VLSRNDVSALDAGLDRWLNDAHGVLRKRRFAGILAGSYALFAVTYLSINEFSVGRAAHTLFLPGEERLPFLPIFEYLYLLTYFIPALLIATVRDAATVRRLVRAYGFTLLVTYTTYLLFPVSFARPRLEVSSLSTWLLSLEYLDKPYNDFPSLHVALSWLAVHASQVSRRSRIGLSMLATGISVSTVFVKQHYVADVLCGFALTWVAWWLARPTCGMTVMSQPRARKNGFGDDSAHTTTPCRRAAARYRVSRRTWSYIGSQPK
jgi:membrane-associated phospholipid phosphatase